jgi:hypothetical protein
MYSSAECRAQAEQKMAQAERDPRRRRNLIEAAQAWLILASQTRRLEASLRVPRKRSRKKPNAPFARLKMLTAETAARRLL